MQSGFDFKHFVGLLLLPLFLGCGSGMDRPATVPVKGVVTYQGTPLAGATVVFAPKEGRPATGTTNDAGEFQLTTFELNDGAIPGHHMVSVQKFEPAESQELYAERKSAIPEIYSTIRTTPLNQTIEDGENPPVTIALED